MSAADEAYDRGVTAGQAHDYPTAILSLLDARQLAPGDQIIATVLDAARLAAETTSHVGAPPPITPTDIAPLWFFVNLALAVIIARRARRVVLGATLLLWIACGVGWAWLRFTRPEYAVVARPDVVAHVADDAQSLERFRLRAGDELFIEERRGDWLKVRSPSGERAYVAATEVLSVEADGKR